MNKLLVLLLLLVSASAQAQIAVRGETVHTMTGPAISDGIVLIQNGKIKKVS